MYDEDDLKLFPVWQHVVTGGLYHVLGVATCRTNGERENKERSVVYFSMDYQSHGYREIAEFLDGRFVPHHPTKGEK